MAKIYEDCLRMAAPESDIICDGCKVQLILFYQFKLKVAAIQLRRLNEKTQEEAAEKMEDDLNQMNDINMDERTENLEDESPVDAAYSDDQSSQKEEEFLIPKEESSSSIIKENYEYSCSHCSATFLLKSALEAHILGLHSNGQSITCTDCHKPFKSNQELEHHKTTIHASKSFVCHICGNRFRKASRLRSHINTKHDKIEDRSEPKPKMIACDICQKILSNKCALRRHKAAVHNVGRINLPYTCKICDSHWPSNASLETHHLVKHTTERNFKCAVCAKSFATKPLLASHITRIHCVTKDFICDTCGKAFKNQAYLNTHSLVHSENRAFVCPDCGVSFKQEATLYSHMKSHREKLAGVKYECQTCQRTFANARTLKKHEMSHTGPDLHCQFCKKKYKQKDSLTKHVLAVHNRIRFRVVCRLCDKTLWNRKIMRTHVLEEHMEELRADPEKSVDDFLENTQIYDNSRKKEKSSLQIISVQILNV